MKKQKIKNNKILKILIAVVILAVATAILVGCIKLKKDEPIEEQLEIALTELLTFPISDDAEAEAILSEIESRNSFKVLSYTETEDKLVVNLLVNAPDLYTLAKELDENYTFETEAEMNSAIIETLCNAEIIEQEITIEFVSVGDYWVPMLTLEFFDSYYGGVLKLLDDALANMNEEAAQ